MSVDNEFENSLYDAAEKKIDWYNTLVLPKMLENYRTFHSAVANMIGLFEKKKLIIADPYKKDKNVVDVSLPDSDDFSDNDGPTVLGIRLSDYETSLDFLCNYMQFSVESLNPEAIKKLITFNSFLDWGDLHKANNKSNNRYFGTIVLSIKNGSDTLSIGLLNNMLTVSAKTLEEINLELKKLTFLHRELYKIDVRKNICDDFSFAQKYASLSVDTAFAELKKEFPSKMEKKRFYPDLVEEIVQEDFGAQKDALRAKLLASFKTEGQKKESKVEKIDTRAMILDVVKIMQSFAPPLDTIQQKLQENHELLQGDKKSGFAKFIESIRNAFGMKNNTIEYKIKAVDMQTQIEKYETVDYHKFMDGLTQRSRMFAAMGSKGSNIYVKLETESEEAILEYVQKRISDCQSLYGMLSGFDNFFKAEVVGANRAKVKGLKIDLDVIKNIIIKANKYKVEYVSTLNTELQMKKLGITNE